jgi:polysaccharide biosynthesis transport protein
MIAAVASRGRQVMSQAMGHAIDELDLAALGRALWRRKLWIATLTLLAGGLAFAGVNLVTPRYKSEARVLIETRDNIFLRPDAEKALDRGSAIDQEAVTSQAQLILSRDLAREVIKTLKLGERAEFDPVLRGSSTIGVLLGLVGLVRDPMSLTPEERVFRSFAERLTAYQVEKSRVIAIEFESENPELAARVANAVAETYLMVQQTAKQDQSRVAGLWLAEKIEPLRGAVADAEAKVEQYRARNNLLVGTNNTTLSNQQLGEINAQLSAGLAQKADGEAKARIIREALRTGAAVEFADIINSELMRRLSEQRVMLRAQLAEQSSTLLDQHPRIKELKAQIADLDRQIRAEADRLARALENDARVASAKVDSLGASLDRLKRQAGNVNEQDVQLRALEREAKAQRDLLESYLAKYREATTRDSVGAGSPDARIISTAIVSNTPSWPKKLPTVLIAALGAFSLTVAFMLSGQLMSGQLSVAVPMSQYDVADDLEASHRILPAAEYSSSQGTSAVEVAADAMIGTVTGGLMGRVAVIGAGAGVDTASIAVLLSRTLAGKGKVVLIDLVPGRSGLSALGADPSVPGISELVTGSASFGEIIARDRHSGTHFIAAGQPLADVASIVQSPRLVITVEALARSYDHVVINAGTLPDMPLEAIAALAPQAVLVADALDEQISASAREHLVAAGFSAVNVLQGWHSAPGPDGSTARAAA